MKRNALITSLVFISTLFSCATTGVESSLSSQKDYCKTSGLYMSFIKDLDDGECIASFNTYYPNSELRGSTVNTFDRFEVRIRMYYEGAFKANKHFGDCITFNKSDYYKATFSRQENEDFYYTLSFNPGCNTFNIEASLDECKTEYLINIDDESSSWTINRSSIKSIWEDYSKFDINDVIEIKYTEYKPTYQLVNGAAKKKQSFVYSTDRDDINAFYALLDSPISGTNREPTKDVNFGCPLQTMTFKTETGSHTCEINDGLILYKRHYFEAKVNPSINNPRMTGWGFPPENDNTVYIYNHPNQTSYKSIKLNVSLLEFCDYPKDKEEPTIEPKYFAKPHGYKIYIYDSKTVKVEEKFYTITSEADFNELFPENTSTPTKPPMITDL